MARRAQRPVSTERSTDVDVARTYGRLGLRSANGWLYEEYDPRLRGANGRRVYRDMLDNSPVVAAARLAIDNTIVGCEWRVQPAGAAEGHEAPPGAEEAAAFVTEVVLKNMQTPWPDVLREMMTAAWYGWSWHEIIYAPRDDGLIGIQDIAIRAQTSLLRWILDPATDQVLGMVQRDPNTGQELVIPEAKSLHITVGGEKRSPEGRSLLRAAYRPWYFIKNLEDIEAIGVERDLAGVPVMYVPKEVLANQETAQPWARVVRDLRFNAQAGLLLPSEPYRSANGDPTNTPQYRLELLSSSNSRQVSIGAIVERHERAIARLLLADFLMLGQGATGSFALSRDKTDLFLQSLKSLNNAFEAVVNTKLLPRLWALNGLPPEIMPRLSADDVAPANLVELSQYLTALAGSGAQLFPDEELEAFLREKAGLPARSVSNESAALPVDTTQDAPEAE